MKKVISLISCLVFVTPFMAQHSTLTSNYLFNLFAINPAYAGNKKALDATVFYRKQWVGLNGAPERYGAMAHLEVKPKNFGVGLQVENEKIALFSDTKFVSAFSYKLKIDRLNFISFALSPGFKRTVTNWNKLITTQSGDATFIDYLLTQNTFLTGVGAFFSNKKFYAGISTPDLIVLSTSKPVEYDFIAGYVYKVNDVFSLKPSTLIRGIKNSPTQFDVSVTAYLQNTFGIGLSYRNKESIIVFGELLATKQFKLGYAFDYNTGALKKFNSGSHEIMINYFFGKTTNAPSPRFF